jgi:hypothetical protein
MPAPRPAQRGHTRTAATQWVPISRGVGGPLSRARPGTVYVVPHRAKFLKISENICSNVLHEFRLHRTAVERLLRSKADDRGEGLEGSYVPRADL